MIEPHVPSPSVRGPHCILLEMAYRGQGVCDPNSRALMGDPRDGCFSRDLLDLAPLDIEISPPFAGGGCTLVIVQDRSDSTRQIAVSETHEHNTSGGNVSRHNDDQPKRGRPSVRRAWPLRAENRGQYSGCFATVLPEMRLRSDLCFPAKKGPALC